MSVGPAISQLQGYIKESILREAHKLTKPLEFLPLDNYTFTLEAIDRVEQLADFKICCASESAYHPSFWSFLDEMDVRAEWWHPKAGDIVLDVGADYGSYTLPALAAGARVHAWSPPFKVPWQAFESRVLTKSCNANGFNDYVIYERGLWSCAGYLAAFDGDRMAKVFDTKEQAEAHIADAPGHCAVFRVAALDSHEIINPSWLKIDAEGGELDILKGGRRTIQQFKPRILLENHLHLDPDCEAKCEAFLVGLGVGYRKVGTRPHGAISHSFFEVA